MDPKDVGASYEAVIRVNSQSGKGGISYILETDHGIRMPRRLQIEFASVLQRMTDTTEREVPSAEIRAVFDREYLENEAPYAFIDHQTVADAHASEIRNLTAQLLKDGTPIRIQGRGRGPLEAYVNALAQELRIALQVVDYEEHATGGGADATAIAFVEGRAGEGAPLYGVGRDPNITIAALKAVTCFVNRALARAKAPSVPLQADPTLTAGIGG